MCPGTTDNMADVQMSEMDRRFDDIDVESILSKMEGRGPLTFSRKRCLYQAPEFVKRLSPEETVEEGTSVRFDCKVTGFPKPTVSWSKDDIIFGDEERATVEIGDNGVFTLCFQDVSKCDEGTYRCRASNGEGTSTCSLYLSVKAKSKCRKRKKNRPVASAPHFPAIVERVAEEKRESEASALQPESPLTHLYGNISMRSPVMWPEFLGEWAYNMEIARGEEDMELGSEDVFENEDVFECDSDNSPTSLPSQTLTFVSSSFTNTDTSEDASKQTKQLESDDVQSLNSENSSRVLEENTDTNKIKEKCNNENLNSFESRTSSSFCAKGTAQLTSDRKNNNENTVRDNEISQTIPRENSSPKVSPVRVCTVSKIIVNRSYAKGDSTFSVATRREESPSRPASLSLVSKKPSTSNGSDTSILQNLSNQRILERMRKQCSSALKSSSSCSVFSLCGSFEDSLLEVIFFVSGSTFLALCFDLPPSTFMMDIFIAILMKAVVEFFFKEI